MNQRHTQSNMHEFDTRATLTPQERARMRGVLREYMAMKPIRPESFEKPRAVWFLSARFVVPGLAFALILSSTGISYAAQGALPGDLLYPVKVHVNEPVRGALATSPATRAAWAADVAGERLKEAATLAAAGALSTSTQDELKSSFETHVAIAADAIAEEASTSPESSTEAGVRIEARLAEYGRVLSEVGSARGIDTEELAHAVRSEGQRLAIARKRTESNIAENGRTADTVRIMSAAARRQIDISEGLAHDVSEVFASSSTRGIAAQLAFASSTASAGDDFAEHAADSDAIGAFQTALSAAESIHTFLNASAAIHARTGLVVAVSNHDDASAPAPHSASRAERRAARFNTHRESEAALTTLEPRKDNDSNKASAPPLEAASGTVTTSAATSSEHRSSRRFSAPAQLRIKLPPIPVLDVREESDSE